MICKKCNHEIGPEQEKCPYCGADNPFAKKHAENMKKFGKAYKKTKGEVITSAQKSGGLAKRATLLAILVIAGIVINVIATGFYDKPDRYEGIRPKNDQGYAALAKEAESILEQGDYVEYVDFLYAHEVRNFPPKEFDHLQRVTYAADEYRNCIKIMEEIVLRSTDPDYFDGLDTDIKSFCMYAESFYEVVEAQGEREKDEKLKACFPDMQKEMEAAMKTYFSMDDQELAEFWTLSRAQKGLRLEEVLRNE